MFGQTANMTPHSTKANISTLFQHPPCQPGRTLSELQVPGLEPTNPYLPGTRLTAWAKMPRSDVRRRTSYLLLRLMIKKKCKILSQEESLILKTQEFKMSLNISLSPLLAAVFAALVHLPAGFQGLPVNDKFSSFWGSIRTLFTPYNAKSQGSHSYHGEIIQKNDRPFRNFRAQKSGDWQYPGEGNGAPL